MGKPDTSGHATDDIIIQRMHFAPWITKTTNIHKDFVTRLVCFRAAMVTRTPLSILLHIYYLPFLYLCWTLQNNMYVDQKILLRLVKRST
jgi:hypothetical protein